MLLLFRIVALQHFLGILARCRAHLSFERVAKIGLQRKAALVRDLGKRAVGSYQYILRLLDALHLNVFVQSSSRRGAEKIVKMYRSEA